MLKSLLLRERSCTFATGLDGEEHRSDPRISIRIAYPHLRATSQCAVQAWLKATMTRLQRAGRGADNPILVGQQERSLPRSK